MDERSRFDAWLERSLRAQLGPDSSSPPPLLPAYTRVSAPARARLPILSGLGAAVASKAVTGFAITAFAVGFTGAAAVQTVSTGSPVPPVVVQELRAVAQDLGQTPPASAPPFAQGPAAAAPITRLPDPAATADSGSHRVEPPVPAALVRPDADRSDSSKVEVPRSEAPKPEASRSEPSNRTAVTARSDAVLAGSDGSDEAPASPKPSPTQRPGGKPTPLPAGLSQPRPKGGDEPEKDE